MDRKYGINVISLWPWVNGINGIEVAKEMALEARFDGLQVLPLRGWYYCNLLPYIDFIISQEDAFNNGGLLECLFNEFKKILGISVPKKSPRLVDWVLFGNNKNLKKIDGNTLYCVHEESLVGDVYEINPGKSTEFVGVFNSEVCVDTKHIREFNTLNANYIGFLDLFEKIPSDMIKLIHVNPVKTDSMDEESMLISGVECELTEMLKILRFKSDAPVILECVPKLNLNKKVRVGYLCELREAVFKYLK